MRTENTLLFSTATHSRNPFHKSFSQSRKKKPDEEFRIILESYLNETAEELEEHRILYPQYGKFWDNGYEDVG